jgi:ABC-type amino acid transport substrate-binding protein
MMRPSNGIGAGLWRRIEFATMYLSMTSSVFRSTSDAFARATRVAVGAALITSLAAGLAALPLSAQAKGKEAAAPDADPPGPHPVLDRIKSTGHIVLAHRQSSVPFAYYDANKQPIGFAVDLCKDIAEAVKRHLGLKTLTIDYVPDTTANRIDLIVSGKADLECGTTTNNAERREKVAFTIPHYITGSRYVVRADSPIAELDQFDNHVLVSTAGSTQFKQIDKANRDRLMNIKIMEVPDNAKAMQMVASGQADGFAMDDVQLYGLIAESADPKKFKVVGKFLTIEPLAIMLSKDDAAFKKVVDDEMRHLIRDGEGDTLYDKWFMKPIPPKNVTMNLPMNYLLRDSWKYPSDIVGN